MARMASIVAIGRDHANQPDRVAMSATIIVVCIAAAKLLIHLLTAARYGIFRDEMYYLACAQHLAWGYVD